MSQLLTLSDEHIAQRAAARASRSHHSRGSVGSIGTARTRESHHRASHLSIIAFSPEELHADDGEVVGISSLLAACLTANYISVGYIFVPWGESKGKASSYDHCDNHPDTRRRFVETGAIESHI